MELFSTNKKKAAPKATKNAPAKKAVPADGRLDSVLVRPWLSEKALIGTEQGVYVFEVPRLATKHDVAAAIEAIYKVTPKKVTMVNLPGKTVSLRTRRGMGARSRRHKAYVHLKKGDSIAF